MWGCGFQTRMHPRGGNVAYISQSGSGMCGIVDVEERIDFNLVVSTGQELAVTIDEYLDYALEMPGTRAVGPVHRDGARSRRPRRGAREGARARHPDRRDQGRAHGALGEARGLALGRDRGRRRRLRRAVRALRRAARARHGRARDEPHHVRAAASASAMAGWSRSTIPAASASCDRPRRRDGRAAHAALAGLDARSSRCSIRACPQSIRSTPGARAAPTATSRCRTAWRC